MLFCCKRALKTALTTSIFTAIVAVATDKESEKTIITAGRAVALPDGRQLPESDRDGFFIVQFSREPVEEYLLVYRRRGIELGESQGKDT